MASLAPSACRSAPPSGGWMPSPLLLSACHLLFRLRKRSVDRPLACSWRNLTCRSGVRRPISAGKNWRTGSGASRPDEGEQVGVEAVLVGGGEAVRRALV